MEFVMIVLVVGGIYLLANFVLGAMGDAIDRAVDARFRRFEREILDREDDRFCAELWGDQGPVLRHGRHTVAAERGSCATDEAPHD
jgi:hypothetical protein